MAQKPSGPHLYSVHRDSKGRYMVSVPLRLAQAVGLEGGPRRCYWEVAGRGALLLRVAPEEERAPEPSPTASG